MELIRTVILAMSWGLISACVLTHNIVLLTRVDPYVMRARPSGTVASDATDEMRSSSSVRMDGTVSETALRDFKRGIAIEDSRHDEVSTSLAWKLGEKH